MEEVTKQEESQELLQRRSAAIAFFRKQGKKGHYPLVTKPPAWGNCE